MLFSSPASAATARNWQNFLQARIHDYIALTKPGIAGVVLTTTLAGFLLADSVKCIIFGAVAAVVYPIDRVVFDTHAALLFVLALQLDVANGTENYGRFRHHDE